MADLNSNPTQSIERAALVRRAKLLLAQVSDLRRQGKRELASKVYRELVQVRAKLGQSWDGTPLNGVIFRLVDDLSMLGSSQRGIVTGLYTSGPDGVFGNGLTDVLRFSKNGLLASETPLAKSLYHEVAHRLEKYLSNEEKILLKKHYARAATKRSLDLPEPYHLSSRSEWWADLIENYENLHHYMKLAAESESPALKRAAAKFMVSVKIVVDNMRISLTPNSGRSQAIRVYKDIKSKGGLRLAK